MAQAGPFGSRLLGPADQRGMVLRVRVQGLLTVTLVVANLIGAVVAVVLSTWVIPGPGPVAATWLMVGVGVPCYVVVALAFGVVWGTGRALRAVRWAIDDRPPTERDRRATVRVPLVLTLMQAFLWGLATVLFTGIVLVIQPALVFTVAFTAGFAGIVVCANAYLLSEFALRPVAARAIGDEPLGGTGVRVRMLLFWCLGTGVPVAGLLLVAVFALVRDTVPTTRLAVTVIVLTGVVLVFGFLVTEFTARAIVGPVRSVRDGMGLVREGHLDTRVAVYDGTELGLLQAGFNRMADGLAERERIRDLFGRHVGREVAEAALAAEVDQRVVAVTVVFVDLVGSTALAATRPPTEVVALLNRFFAVVVDEVDRHGGTINKFVGDAALAVFGAPLPLDDHAGRALATARAVATRLPRELPTCQAGIGVATGQVVAGNIGAQRRFEYTVIGDPVNEAARLTELAKSSPGNLLASSRAVDEAHPDEAAHWRTTTRTTLRGRTEDTLLAVPRES
ncbi:adenylate/guanylate cyclase domain-containing protein [Actinokineospora cianjurensis]|uniref:Adenylate cyclase n=1 Tax=Actinokineospora cianjurensis TaxID=585224 RepID=A0A421AW72_9PSEU|nr:adenylate/guanylate cyclase domain-containing protein [Actinokineospora cianjurensis]RLK53727.1 adenylate cyclase [Actinokineospora cianjurensis]